MKRSSSVVCFLLVKQATLFLFEFNLFFLPFSPAFMRNRLLILVGACAISLLSLNVASVQAQSSTVTTSATFSDMLSTFPQAVLSTINSVVLQSTNASSATTPFDSTARKDNLALQMGMWESGRVGVGVKYWLSELTALRVGVNFAPSIGISGSGDINSFAVNSLFKKDTTVNNNTSGQAIRPSVSPNVTLNLGVSAAIEKHLFPRKNLTPFVGFGLGISLNSTNYSTFSGVSNVIIDTSRSGNYYTQYYIDPNSQYVNNVSRQEVVIRTSISVSASVLAGVEYFVIPSLSLTAQAALSGSVNGGVVYQGSFDQNNRITKTSAANQNNPSTTVDQINNQSQNYISLATSFSFGFSSSLTLSLYFGRNVLGDIVNAFTSGTLFQW